MVQYIKGGNSINFLIFILYIIYMLVNLYTDSKYMETYNRWHLAFLIILSSLYVLNHGSFPQLLITIFLSLLAGLLVENIRAIRIGPGDTKMLIVSAVFLLTVTNLKVLFIVLFSVLLMKVYLLLFAVTFVVMALIYHKVVKHDKKGEGTFRFYAYSVTIKQMANQKLPTLNLSVPATGGILLSSITLYFLF